MPLFKYVPPERIDILTKKLLRFTQPGAFNDPFETFPCFAGLSEDCMADVMKDHRPSREKIEKMVEESLAEELRKQFGANPPPALVEALRRNPFVQERISEIGPISEKLMREFLSENGELFSSLTVNAALDAINRQFGLLCLTEKPDNLLMWAHYANSHTGLVFEFNEKHSFFNRAEKPKELGRCLHKIAYVKTRPQRILFGPQMDEDDFLAGWAKDIFFSKSEHWSYEEEWRMIEYLRDCKQVIKDQPHDTCLFPVPLECIMRVIFGCKTSDDVKSLVRHAIAADPQCHHIRVSQAIIDDKEYALKFHDVA